MPHWLHLEDKTHKISHGFYVGRKISRGMKQDSKVWGLRNRKRGVAMSLGEEVREREMVGLGGWGSGVQLSPWGLGFLLGTHWEGHEGHS